MSQTLLDEEYLNFLGDETEIAFGLDIEMTSLCMACEKGDLEIVKYEDYTSHNTRQLKINEIIELLMKVDVVKDSLNE